MYPIVAQIPSRFAHPLFREEGIFWRQRDLPPSDLSKPLADIRAGHDRRIGRRLLCAACGQAVTDQDQGIAVQGSHAHTCANPHGIVFHIGCFGRAPGCAHTGVAVQAHSWFSGYSWQIATCAGCGEHLGWRFRDQSGEGFHALILARLVAEQ